MNFATKSCASHSAWASRPCPPSPSSIMAWAGASSSQWTTRPAITSSPTRIPPVSAWTRSCSIASVRAYPSSGIRTPTSKTVRRSVGTAGQLWLLHRHRDGLHLPEGKHFQFGVDRERPLPTDPGELQRLVADLQLFAVHAQDSAMRLLVPPTTARTTGPHTARTGSPALDHGWQDRLGSGRRAGHQRAHRGISRQQCRAQAGLHQQAAGSAQGTALGLIN
jgi:hypothetical protein